MNVTIPIKKKKEMGMEGFGGEDERHEKEQAPPLCACAVQKGLGLMGDEDAQPPVGYTSNYAT